MAKVKVFKRPYATMYYADAKATVPGLVSQGFCSSDRGAIRASVVRIFMGEYKKAVIYDRKLGIPVYTVQLGKGGLQAHYGDSSYKKGTK